MTTAPIEVAMTVTEATSITARIKLLVQTITETTEKVTDLIEKAEAGRAWQALGYSSWTSYVAEEFSDVLTGLARAERIPVVEKLSAAGMSTRAIAPVVGVSNKTISQDLAAARVTPGNTSPVTGVDGKVYTRHGRPTSAGMVELAKAVPAPRKRPRRPLIRELDLGVCQLRKSVDRLEHLADDDRLARLDGKDAEGLADQIADLSQRLHDRVTMRLIRQAVKG
jgi:hypothetical protein